MLTFAWTAIGDFEQAAILEELARLTTSLLRQFNLETVDLVAHTGEVGDDPPWLLYVTEAEIHSTEAKARGYLGQHDKAATIYRETIGTQQLQPRDEASYRVYYAASLAHLGDIHTAVAEGLTALTMLEGAVRSPRLVSELRPVRTLVIASAKTDANEFQTRVDALTSRADAS